MGTSIEKFKIIEKIKLSYLKTRGNVIAIANELNLPVEYVQKVVKKFKKQESRDVVTLISNNLMSHIMFGYESRIVNMMEMLKALEGRDQPVVSICCESPVRRNEASQEWGHEDYECIACNQRCEIKALDKESIVNLKIKLLQELREEDKLLVDFAVKMGYTQNTGEPSTIIQNRQNILVVKGAEQDAQVIRDMKKLPPMEKEKLVEKLRAEMVNIDVQIEEETRKTEETD